LAWCTALVKSTITDRPACGLLNSDGTTNLIAINAGWDFSKPAPDFSVDTQVVFACKDPGGDDPNDVVGALGKCVRFGFYNIDDPSSRSQFLACIRATRADFCSNGVSLTEPGTPYALYTYPLQQQQKQPDAGICVGRLNDGGTVGNCWEATWNEDGATCMNHRRYLELLYLAASDVRDVWHEVTAGKGEQSPKPNGLQPQVIVQGVNGPKVVRPPPTGPVARAASTLSQNYWDLLAKENVLLQCPQPSPVLNCLKKFTTYYYDDAHWMWWMVDANPVDSVTAQVVCKPQYFRTEPGVVMTRTAIHFPNAPGSNPQYDILPCCDTLGDCSP
jgi:hypothetical protein